MSLKTHTYLILSTFILIIFPTTQLHSEMIGSSASDSARINYSSRNQVALSDSIINYGKLFLKTPYRYGSTGTSTFDCSGFTSHVYRNFGYDLNRSSVDQSRQFDSVDRSQLKAGDLVFFSGRKRSKSVGHVGIVVAAKGNGEFEFIHAAMHKGVTISNSSESYYTKRFLKAGRVLAVNPLLNVVHKFLLPKKSNTEAAAPSRPTYSRSSQPSVSAPVPPKQVKKVVPAEYHRVKSGETLSEIAEKYGMTVAELKQKNNIKGNKLSLKQKLKVKDAETVLIADATQKKTTEVADNKPTTNVSASLKSDQASSVMHAGLFHTVKKGESLFSISKLYDVSIDQLKKLNSSFGGKIRPGQELKVQDDEPNKNVVAAKQESSQKTTKHKVASGESLYSISKKYNISIDELKRINNIPNGKIRPGQELKMNQQATSAKSVEVAKVETPQKEKGTTHKVTPGESLYSISKKYNISIDELKRVNNIPTGKIKPGQELKISQQDDNDNKAKNLVAEKSNNKQAAKTEASDKTITHKIKKGESLISIAKDNNISVEELKKINNLDDSKIRFGQEIKLTQSAGKTKNTSSKKAESTKSIQHTVKSGESYYSIAKDYGCTVDDLKEWNNKPGSKIKVGEKIIVKSN